MGCRSSCARISVALAMLSWGCQLPHLPSSEADTDAQDDGVPQGDEGPGTPGSVPAGGGCTNDSQCGGGCDWCDDGVCVEDHGCCAIAEGWGFRCSEGCFDDSDCDEGYQCDGWDCIPDPDPPGALPPPCAARIGPSLTTLTLASAVEDLAALDVDADGVAEIVAVDAANILSAFRPDGSIVATLDLAQHVASDLWAVDGSLVVAGQTAAGVYGLARVDVVEPSVLAITASEPAAGDLDSPTNVRDFDGDGAQQLDVVVGGRLHDWALGSPPSLVSDVAAPFATLHLDAIDLDADGLPERVGLDAAFLSVVTISGEQATLQNSQPTPGAGRATAILGGGTVDRLVVASEVLAGDQYATRLSVVDGSGGVPWLRDPFGAPHRFRWMIDVDLDGDGLDELAVAYSTPDHAAHLYRVAADGTAQCHEVVLDIGMDAPATGDVTGDGVEDLVARDGLLIQIWSIDA